MKIGEMRRRGMEGKTEKREKDGDRIRDEDREGEENGKEAEKDGDGREGEEEEGEGKKQDGKETQKNE